VLCERVDAYYKQLVEQYSFDALPDTTGSPTKTNQEESENQVTEKPTEDEVTDAPEDQDMSESVAAAPNS